MLVLVLVLTVVVLVLPVYLMCVSCVSSVTFFLRSIFVPMWSWGLAIWPWVVQTAELGFCECIMAQWELKFAGEVGFPPVHPNSIGDMCILRLVSPSVWSVKF